MAILKNKWFITLVLVLGLALLLLSPITKLKNYINVVVQAEIQKSKESEQVTEQTEINQQKPQEFKNHPLNSKEYWDGRFKSGDWQDHFGDQQTLHFYTLLLNAIPEDIQKEIEKSGWSVVDFGCAQGEGTEYFAKMLKDAKVTGVDFSEAAIEIAGQKNSAAKFLAIDLTKDNNVEYKWDVLISSNTLEHFYEPWQVLGKLSSRVRKYMVILVPFDQQGIPNDEHFYSFNYQNIPDKINNFKLAYTKIVYPDPKFWGEQQILLIYANANK